MTTLQEAAMRKALDALEWCVEQGGGPVCEHESGGVICFCKENSAIESLKSALAQQGEQQRIQELEQELAAEIELRGKLEQECVNWRVKYTNLEMAQQGQEPFATVTKDAGRMQIEFIGDLPDGETMRLYTAAPAPQAQPVAAQDWKAVYIGCGDWDLDGPVTEEDWKLAARAPQLLKELSALQSTQPAQPLTDEQIIAIMERLGITVAGPASDAVIALTREVEAAHGIKKARGE